MTLRTSARIGAATVEVCRGRCRTKRIVARSGATAFRTIEVHTASVGAVREFGIAVASLRDARLTDLLTRLSTRGASRHALAPSWRALSVDARCVAEPRLRRPNTSSATRTAVLVVTADVLAGSAAGSRNIADTCQVDVDGLRRGMAGHVDELGTERSSLAPREIDGRRHVHGLPRDVEGERARLAGVLERAVGGAAVGGGQRARQDVVRPLGISDDRGERDGLALRQRRRARQQHDDHGRIGAAATVTRSAVATIGGAVSGAIVAAVGRSTRRSGPTVRRAARVPRPAVAASEQQRRAQKSRPQRSALHGAPLSHCGSGPATLPLAFTPRGLR